MSRGLYTLVFALLLPFIILRILYRSLQAPDYRQRIDERLGFVDPVGGEPLWIHAVSVGEVLAIAPLIEKLLAEPESAPVLITTTTPTGASQVKRLFDDRVEHRFLPWDLPLFFNLFLKRTQPRACVIVETELWPNMLYACQKYSIPVLLANARLSERSARGYQRFFNLTRQMLGALSKLCVQNAEDAERFIQLGAAKESVLVTGSIKFDAEIPEQLISLGKRWRQSWNTPYPIWIGASTHQGEDEILLRVWQRLTERGIQSRLIIVPRHPERFDSVYQLAQRFSDQVGKRSESELSDKTEIWIGDTLGELPAFYAMADFAVVGGSFSGTGGHNPLEPALLAKPILMGPSRFNFKLITEQLIDTEALRVVDSESELAVEIEQLINDPGLIQIRGEAGKAYVMSSRGALTRLLTEVQALI